MMTEINEDFSYIFNPSEQFPNGIYLFNTFRFESKCFQCSELTEVWTLYSYLDRQYIRLCLFDIHKFMSLIFLAFQPRKDGSIRAYDLTDFIDPDAELGHLRKVNARPNKPIAFVSEFYCQNCELIGTHQGTSEWRIDGNHLFTGSCNNCSEAKVGNIYDLWNEVRRLEAPEIKQPVPDALSRSVDEMMDAFLQRKEDRKQEKLQRERAKRQQMKSKSVNLGHE